VAGIIARLLSSAPNKPTGFILTTALGIAGAFLATFIGQVAGWYAPDQGAGLCRGDRRRHCGALHLDPGSRVTRSLNQAAAR
jgi:hypothetical protein